MQPIIPTATPITVLPPDTLRELQISGELFNGVVTDHVKSLLNDATFRTKVIQIVNDTVNIPMISEGMEGQLFGQAYDWVVIAIVAALNKID